MCHIDESQLVSDGIGDTSRERNKDYSFLLNKVIEELRLLGRISWPILMTSFLLHSRFIISMLFLTKLGTTEAAGGTLSMGFANVTGYSIIKGLAMGMEAICCQAYGAKRWDVLNQTYQKTLLLLLLTTIPISLLWFNTETILLLLGQNPEITSVAHVFIVYSLPDLLAQAILYPTRIFLKAQCLTTPTTIASLFAILIHFPINYFLVFNLNLRVAGVALASAWFTLQMNLSLFVYMGISNKVIKPWVQTGSVFCLQEWRPLLSLAGNSVLSVCLEWWWYEVMLFLSGLLIHPKASVAAMGILIQVTGLIYVFPSSLGLGLSTRVGHELGANHPASAQFAVIVGLILAALLGLSAFGFTFTVRNCLGRLFTSEPEVLNLISIALPILGFCELGNCPQTVACGVLTGSARPEIGARINLVAFYLVGLPTAIAMSFWLDFGFVGLWSGLVAAQISCKCMMLCALACTDWTHQADRSKELTNNAEASNGDLEASLLG